MKQLSIDPEFYSLIVPLKIEEFQLLEQSILDEGLRVPLDIWKGKNVLIDGHHRYKICQKYKIEIRVNEIKFADRNEVKLWIIRNQMARRNLTKYARCELAYKLKPMIKKVFENKKDTKLFKKFSTLAELAKLATVSKSTMENFEYIQSRIDDKTRFELIDGKSKITSLYKKFKSEEKRLEEKEKISEIKLTSEWPKVWPPGRFQDLAKDISNDSIDAIITDPPYAEEYTGEWEFLAGVAERILKPGGYLITYSGKIHLFEVGNILSSRLIFYWPFILLHTGQKALIKSRKINTAYKPILVFQKPPFKAKNEFCEDVISGSGREKFGHKWQQSEEELKEIMEIFTKQQDLILDPYAGAGTTLAVAKRLKRKAIGIEKDADMVRKIYARLKKIK